MSKCILIVDDSEIVRRSMRVVLESAGFEVCGEAANGKEAILRAQELSPDLIVLDLSMPVMNGLDAARSLNRLMPRVRLIMCTNHGAALPPKNARAAGISVVVSKDEAVVKLVNCAQQLLN